MTNKKGAFVLFLTLFSGLTMMAQDEQTTTTRPKEIRTTGRRLEAALLRAGCNSAWLSVAMDNGGFRVYDLVNGTKFKTVNLMGCEMPSEYDSQATRGILADKATFARLEAELAEKRITIANGVVERKHLTKERDDYKTQYEKADSDFQLANRNWGAEVAANQLLIASNRLHSIVCYVSVAIAVLLAGFVAFLLFRDRRSSETVDLASEHIARGVLGISPDKSSPTDLPVGAGVQIYPDADIVFQVGDEKISFRWDGLQRKQGQSKILQQRFRCPACSQNQSPVIVELASAPSEQEKRCVEHYTKQHVKSLEFAHAPAGSVRELLATQYPTTVRELNASISGVPRS